MWRQKCSTPWHLQRKRGKRRWRRKKTTTKKQNKSVSRARGFGKWAERQREDFLFPSCLTTNSTAAFLTERNSQFATQILSPKCALFIKPREHPSRTQPPSLYVVQEIVHFFSFFTLFLFISRPTDLAIIRSRREITLWGEHLVFLAICCTSASAWQVLSGLQIQSTLRVCRSVLLSVLSVLLSCLSGMLINLAGSFCSCKYLSLHTNVST